jgi:crotonobetainyl-CoA:carnitine CoA-transferase CaiB-like acyl-CoA transferase
LSDLKAGDEVFTQTLLALLEQTDSGRGRVIDVSMAQVALSWLQTFLPMLDMGSPPSELRRAGNEHRQFIPVNAYPTRDGFVFVAIGSDVQWRRLVTEPMFSSLNQERFLTNEGRRSDREQLHKMIGSLTEHRTSSEVTEVLTRASVPHSPITPIEEVMDLPFVAPTLLRTTTPEGQVIRLPPPAVTTPFLEECGGELGFAPAYGENTDTILRELGLGTREIDRLHDEGVIA